MPQKQKQKLHVKIGDMVTVISGFHKNETGEIIKINQKTGKVMLGRDGHYSSPGGWSIDG